MATEHKAARRGIRSTPLFYALLVLQLSAARNAWRRRSLRTLPLTFRPDGRGYWVTVPLTDLNQNLRILSDAAKYDASCASSESTRTGTPTGLGPLRAAGIRRNDIEGLFLSSGIYRSPDDDLIRLARLLQTGATVAKRSMTFTATFTSKSFRARPPTCL